MMGTRYSCAWVLFSTLVLLIGLVQAENDKNTDYSGKEDGDSTDSQSFFVYVLTSVSLAVIIISFNFLEVLGIFLGVFMIGILVVSSLVFLHERKVFRIAASTAEDPEWKDSSYDPLGSVEMEGMNYSPMLAPRDEEDEPRISNYDVIFRSLPRGGIFDTYTVDLDDLQPPPLPMSHPTLRSQMSLQPPPLPMSHPTFRSQMSLPPLPTEVDSPSRDYITPI